MLRLDAVNVFIQSSHILRGVSLEVAPGALVCLVGRNGAGKTTTLRTVMGYLRPASGRIELDGAPIAALRTHEIARLDNDPNHPERGPLLVEIGGGR